MMITLQKNRKYLIALFLSIATILICNYNIIASTVGNVVARYTVGITKAIYTVGLDTSTTQASWTIGSFLLQLLAPLIFSGVIIVFMLRNGKANVKMIMLVIAGVVLLYFISVILTALFTS